MLKRILQGVLIVILLVVLGGGGFLWYLHRRALPQIDGTVAVTGLRKPVEILRDRWGTPHIFASNLEDAAYAQGWAVAQDRLFQLELLRRVTQGRMAEMVGSAALDLDKLHRTLDLYGEGRRMLERSSPRTHAAMAAYARGVNAYVASLGGRLPPEFAILRIGFAPLQPDDMMGVIPLLVFGLMDAWFLDPLTERLAEKLGPERFARLFPYGAGGPVAAYPPSAGLEPSVILAGAASMERLGLAVGPGVSNNWVVAPRKSVSGQAMLGNDPHLGLSLPPIWYTLHVSTPEVDVAGVTVPGFPFIAIGHNRDIAWGLTNLMADGADFFVEKLNPDRPGEAMYRGQWVQLEERQETIQVKGAAPVTLTVRTSPHGPIVSDLMKGQTQALSFRWTVNAATDANDLEAFFGLNTARTWTEFRAALRGMGGVAQNFAYADRAGNIGVQAAGRIPVRQGNTAGNRFRVGWDGTQEWSGFVPFERMPFSFNPPQGWIATANTSPFARPAPFYLSSYFEPRDRWLRIREVMQSKDKLTAADLQALQFDHVWVGGRELAQKVREIYAAQPPADAIERAALKLLENWNGGMEVDSPAAALLATLFPALYDEVFTDELGPELANAVQGNLRWVLLRQVLEGDTVWLDRVDTPEKEGWPEVIRPAFSKAVATLTQQLGSDPASWTWSRLHTFEATHAVGRAAKPLAWYFNRGPFPVPGGAMTVGKMQYPPGGFKVNHGASMREITDFADLDGALVVLPGGESGIPASAHYADDLLLWLQGRYHPLALSRAAVERELEGKLVLQPDGK